jgi:hypothetical protein
MKIRKEAFFIREHTTFLTILKQLITEKEINEIRKRHEYEKVARSFTVTALLHFLTRSGCKRRARTIRLSLFYCIKKSQRGPFRYYQGNLYFVL